MKFKPSDSPRRFKPMRAKRNINPISIPDGVRRDIILESDPIYCGNFQKVVDGVRSGKLSFDKVPALRKWLMMASLRRNKVSKTDAARLSMA